MGDGNEHEETEEEENWNGRWLPARSDDPIPPPKVLHQTGVFKDNDIQESGEHRVGMGMQPHRCDDGKVKTIGEFIFVFNSYR